MSDLFDFLSFLLGGRPGAGPDTHKHRCGYAPRGKPPLRGCGLVFEHDRPPRGTSDADYEVAHRCPGCGVVNTWRYHGRTPVGQKQLKRKEKSNG